VTRLVLAAALLAGCYAPTANPGAPCAPTGECPSGQECRTGRCYLVGAPFDAESLFDESLLEPLPDAPSYIPWGTPVELTSLETPGNGESDPSVTADALTAVLTGETAVDDTDIYIATRSALGDTFSFSLLTAVNATGFNDKSPEISADGKTLYFTSNRSGNDEVYISTFSTTWSAPTIVTQLSSASDDSDLAISPDGLTAAVVRDGSTARIYIYKRASTADTFGSPTLHTELSVTADIAAPTITNGGAIIYLHAEVPRDLYRATLKGNGTYTMPMPVTELNTAAVRDAAPFVSQTDDYMIFERASDIYETSR
jgi:dipeptidyl aminopeptidase/acylaminoacyl peptidase